MSLDDIRHLPAPLGEFVWSEMGFEVGLVSNLYFPRDFSAREAYGCRCRETCNPEGTD